MDKIICLGKNYSEHAKELGEVQPEKPVIFIKPPSVLKSVGKNGERIGLLLPQGRGQVHHECEIVFRLGKTLEIEAVSLGLDMTLRDVQSELKKKGQPWTISKVFRDSAIVGPWIELKNFLKWEEIPFEFDLNGILKQKAAASQMLLKTHEIVSFVKEFFPICPGDLIFTGTPSGVGPVSEKAVGRLKWGSIDYEVIWQ